MRRQFHQTVTVRLTKKFLRLLDGGWLSHLQNVQPYLALHFCKGLGRSERTYDAVHYLVREGVNLVALKTAAFLNIFLKVLKDTYAALFNSVIIQFQLSLAHICPSKSARKKSLRIDHVDYN